MKHKYAVKLLCLVFSLLLGSQFSYAEGSINLYPSSGATGRRSALVSHTKPLYNQAQPFMNRGTHKVFAFKDEIIYIGSSAQGFTAGSINVYYPSTVATLADGSRSTITPDASSGTTAVAANTDAPGRILNRSEEINGPNIPGTSITTTGYHPFVVVAPETGVYEVDFLAPGANQTADLSGSVPSGQSDVAASSTSWTQATDNTTEAIVAWDITVANGTAIKSGRVYMNEFNAVGALTFTGTDHGFYGKFYIVTKDGFPYRVENNGMVGGAFAFFVNNRGFTTIADGAGDKTYKSYDYTGITPVPTPKVKNPNEPDDALNITHKIFYNQPDPNLPETATYNGVINGTWLKLALPPDPSATGITFTGVEGSNSYASTKGAIIEFNANVAGTYRITIPGGTTNGVTYYDRVLAGPTVFGHNSVHWDGKTGVNGDPLTAAATAIPPGTTIGQIKVQLLGAEVHFPFLDMESNPNGIKIIQLDKVTYAAPTDGTKDEVFWDDSAVPVLTSQRVSNPQTVVLGSAGQHSSGATPNGHNYSSTLSSPTEAASYGNQRAMDTYSFVPGPELMQR